MAVDERITRALHTQIQRQYVSSVFYSWEYHATWLNKKGETKIRITYNYPKRRKYPEEDFVGEYVTCQLYDMDTYGWILIDVVKVQVIKELIGSYKSVIIHMGKTHSKSDYEVCVKKLQKRRKQLTKRKE